MAGGQHHHRTNIDKFHPGYFGKVGMRYFHKTQQKFWKPTINLDKVREIEPSRSILKGEGSEKSGKASEGKRGSDAYCICPEDDSYDNMSTEKLLYDKIGSKSKWTGIVNIEHVSGKKSC